MSDNLKIVDQSIDSVLDENKAPGEIKVTQHNALVKDLLGAVGKYAGFSFNAKKEPDAGVVNVGDFIWNNNPMNTTINFDITLSKQTKDLNDIDQILDLITQGSLIKFKDYEGRSVLLEYQSHIPAFDVNTDPIYIVTVKGFASNTNYNYDSGDFMDAFIEFFLKSTTVTSTDELINKGADDTSTYVEHDEITSIATTGQSVRNASDVEQFLSVEKILFEGVTFDAGQQKVIIDPKTPFTVFIDTVSGNDGSGEVENKNKPYLTESAAIAALPVDDGTIWILEYIDTGVTRIINTAFTARKFKVSCASDGVFRYTGVTGDNSLPTYLELDIPFCDFEHQSVTPTRFGSLTGEFKLNCNNIIKSTPSIGTGGFFVSSPTAKQSYIIANEFDTVNSGSQYNINMSGLYKVGLTKLHGGGSVFLSGGDLEVDTSIESNGASYNNFLFNFINARIKIRNVSGTTELDIFRTFIGDATVDIDGVDLGVGSDLVIIANTAGNASGSNKTITVKGTAQTLTEKIRFLRRAGGAQGGNKLVLDNFTAYTNTLDIADQWEMIFINPNIIVDNAFINLPVHNLVNTEIVGFGTIKQNTPGDLVTGATVATNINHNGFNHNSTGDGANVTFTNLTPNTK